MLLILTKYDIREINWAYVSDQELLAVCIFRKIFRRPERIVVKTDSEDISGDRFLWLRKFILRNTDFIVVESRNVYDIYQRLVPGLPIKIVYNPSMFEAYYSGIKTGSRQRNTLLFVGRVSQEKNILGFLAASSECIATNPQLTIAMALLHDDPVYERLVMNEVSQLRAQGIKVSVEWSPDIKTLCDIYQNAFALLITSVREGVPNIISDAFFLEVPVIATRCGNMEDLVDSALVCDGMEEIRHRVKMLTDARFYEDNVLRNKSFYLDNMALDRFTEAVHPTK